MDIDAFLKGQQAASGFTSPILQGIYRGQELDMWQRQFEEQQRQRALQEYFHRQQLALQQEAEKRRQQEYMTNLTTMPGFIPENAPTFPANASDLRPLPTGGYFSPNARMDEALKQRQLEDEITRRGQQDTQLNQFRLNNAPYLVSGSEASKRGVYAAPEGIDTGLRPVPGGQGEYLDVGKQKQDVIDVAQGKKQVSINPDMENDSMTQAIGLVEGTIDPSQLSKRSATYGHTLALANKYSIDTYNRPFNIAQASSDYKFATNPQTQNTLKHLNSLTGPDNKSGNLEELIKISDSINRTEFPSLNDAASWARLETGDPQMAAFHATAIEVADQVAKILQGGGGNQTSDMKMKQSLEIFDKRFTKEQVRAISTTMRNLLANRKNNMIGSNRYLMQQYGGGVGETANRPDQNATNAPDVSQSDSEAINWARQNPDNPKAKEILRLNGL